jgi:hypothetical protein
MVSMQHEKKRAVLCVKYHGKTVKEEDFFMKHKMSLNFVLKDESRNKQENEFRTI